MTSYLANAFSLNMLSVGAEGMRVDIQLVLPAEIPAETVSIIGHADMAAIVSSVLKRPVEVNRESVLLQKDDVLFVAQYHGPRLPAGATTLSAGGRIEFYRITCHTK
ncbi:MAG: DUF1874 domain-containing protein [Anaerolineae bacterium]|nr:DUF1874 domain-containing protein [Anaerolineae bacterium]MBL8105215.1 DUF1874 domain-containing protein [Anaerolineales bacterium]MCC7187862.1 DUF1874 domain-containing protein [Anaerolineales bacterium]